MTQKKKIKHRIRQLLVEENKKFSRIKIDVSFSGGDGNGGLIYDVYFYDDDFNQSIEVNVTDNMLSKYSDIESCVIDIATKEILYFLRYEHGMTEMQESYVDSHIAELCDMVFGATSKNGLHAAYWRKTMSYGNEFKYGRYFARDSRLSSMLKSIDSKFRVVFSYYDDPNILLVVYPNFVFLTTKAQLSDDLGIDLSVQVDRKTINSLKNTIKSVIEDIAENTLFAYDDKEVMVYDYDIKAQSMSIMIELTISNSIVNITRTGIKSYERLGYVKFNLYVSELVGKDADEIHRLIIDCIQSELSNGITVAYYT